MTPSHKPRLLVTGLSQPIGQYTVELARQAGLTVRALTDRAPPAGQFQGVELVTGRLHDDAALRDAVRDVDLVCHTAFLARGSLEDLRRENAAGTRRLLEACAGDISRLVLIGTPSVYASHPTPDTWPVRADAAREAHGPPQLVSYGQSMIEAEDFVLEASTRYGMDYTILRTATTWGRNPYPQGVANALMRNPQQAAQVNQALGPLQWIHAVDAARAALLAAQSEAARNQTFLVAAETASTAFDLLALLWEISKPGEANPFSAQAATHRLAQPKLDTSKIQEMLGFRPAVALRQCLEEALGMVEISG